jgi:hypothetical protein
MLRRGQFYRLANEFAHRGGHATLMFAIQFDLFKF